MVLDAKTSKNKTITLPKTMTLDDGTEKSTSFNDTAWGETTGKRMDFVNNDLRASSLETVMEKVKRYMPATSGSSSTSATDPDDQLVDLSDSDDECQWNFC